MDHKLKQIYFLMENKPGRTVPRLCNLHFSSIELRLLITGLVILNLVYFENNSFPNDAA